MCFILSLWLVRSGSRGMQSCTAFPHLCFSPAAEFSGREGDRRVERWQHSPPGFWSCSKAAAPAEAILMSQLAQRVHCGCAAGKGGGVAAPSRTSPPVPSMWVILDESMGLLRCLKISRYLSVLLELGCTTLNLSTRTISIFSTSRNPSILRQ